MKDVIYSKKYKVHIYKYENLENNILKLKSILSLDNEKIKFNKIQLKNLNINSKTKHKLKFDQEDIKLIKKEGKYFFDKYQYSKKVPKVFLNI